MRRLWVVLAFLVAADAALAQQKTLGAAATDNAAAFRGLVGRRVTYVCPANFSLASSVWGTDVYTDDSPICLSAVHAGVLQAGTAGAVTFVMGGEAASFQGSTRNGVKSQSYTHYPSMQFDAGGAPGQVDWATTGANLPQGFASPVVVTCPARGVTSNTLWGTDVYADDSLICVAAVHAGVITLAAGGPVEVTPAPGAASYASSVKNGITSQAYGAWTASFRVAAPSGASTAPAGNTVTGIGVGVTALGLATVRWAAPSGAQSYVVVRWKSDDATCCNNLSPPGGPLTATQWVDNLLLQKHGLYSYRVYAHTSAGVLAGETSIDWNGTAIEAPVFTRPPGTGTLLTERAPDSATAPTLAPVDAVTAIAQPTATALTVDAGRYRVTLTGVQVTATTKDIFDSTDGQGDEIAAVAIAMYFERSVDRSPPILRGLGAVRGVEYGDINALRKEPDRRRAGHAADSGGLVSRDVVPEGFTPGNSRGTPGAREFPLLVWEGTLSTGRDAVLIVPSLWERDIARARLDQYVNGWLTGANAQTLTAADVQVPLPGVLIVQTTFSPGPPTAFAVGDLAAHLVDRPLGLTLQPLVVEYHDRFIVLTHEKLRDLAAGSYRSLAIQYVEPASDPVLGGDYTLEMRIERF
jgi:hypothetical protein